MSAAGQPAHGGREAVRWGWLSYDRQLDLVYYGTANPSPWSDTVRPGDKKFSAGVFARKPEDGSARWFYQLDPHDLFDHKAVNEFVLLDLEVGGQTRQVMVHRTAMD